MVVWTGLPQLTLLHAWHSAFAAGFMKSHSATRLPLPSVHPRFVVCTKVTPGLLMVYESPLYGLCRYLLKLTLTAVRPLPNTS
ncbi:hypothetical protein D3C83_36500 [compost metagenome]